MSNNTNTPANTNGMTHGTLFYGSFLLFLGVASYLLTGRQSITALIPSFFGLIVLPMGLLSLAKPAQKRHFLHVSAALSLLGIFGTFKGLLGFIQMLSGAETARPEATMAQAAMCVASAIYLFFCVRSFIAARVLRKTV